MQSQRRKLLARDPYRKSGTFYVDGQLVMLDRIIERLKTK
jgi:hypothetical protein